MSEDEENDIPEVSDAIKAAMTPTTAIIRVKAWTAWLPQESDPNNPGASIAQGSTAVKLLPGEAIMEIKTTPTPLTAAIVVDDGEGGEREVPAQMMGFEITTAYIPPSGIDPKNLIDPQPTPEESAKMAEGYIRSAQAKQKLATVESGATMRGHKAPGGKPRPIK